MARHRWRMPRFIPLAYEQKIKGLERSSGQRRKKRRTLVSAAVTVSPQWQRSDFGIWPNTCSTWAPHPAQVGFLHCLQVTALHIPHTVYMESTDHCHLFPNLYLYKRIERDPLNPRKWHSRSHRIRWRGGPCRQSRQSRETTEKP